jgi:alkylmercury lyase
MSGSIHGERGQQTPRRPQPAQTARMPEAVSESIDDRVASIATRQQLADALASAFPECPDARWVLRAIVRLLVRGAPVHVEDLARALGWSRDRVDGALVALPFCERGAGGTVIGAGLSARRSRHIVQIAGRRLFTSRTLHLFLLPVLAERAFVVSSPCSATDDRIRLQATPLGLRDCDPAGAVAFVPLAPHSSAQRPGDAHLFRSAEDAEPWLALGPSGALVPIKRAFEIGVELGRQGFVLEPPPESRTAYSA